MRSPRRGAAKRESVVDHKMPGSSGRFGSAKPLEVGGDDCRSGIAPRVSRRYRAT